MKPYPRTFPATGLVLLALLAAFPSRSACADETITLQDFETGLEINTWPPEAARPEFSTNWTADGSRSLLIHGDTMAAIDAMTTRDWSPYQLWRLHVNVPGNEGVVIGLEIADNVGGYHNRHQNSASAAPGESVVTVDVGGNLWRGERNRPYRDKKSPIDKQRINRFAITAYGHDLYVDRIELARSVPLSSPGGFAFDLGNSNQPVQSGWIGIGPDTRWNETNGFGITRGARSLGMTTPYPTLVMGDGLKMGDAALEVRLPGGRYLGWVLFERAGFWEDEQAAYTNAALLANGEIAASHSARVNDAWFELQDVEALSQEDIVHRMVLKRQKVADFTFNAIAGRNRFTLDVQGVRGEVPRLAGLVLAPDTPEGRAFLQGHKERQYNAIAATHQLLRKARREGDPAKASAPLLLAPLPTHEAMTPEDWPAITRSQPVPDLAGFPGMTVYRLVGLYATQELSVAAAVTDLAGGNGVIPRTAIRLAGNHYLPTHGYNETAVTLETHDYRPFDVLRLHPTLSRCILVSVDIPAGTKPGRYTGSLELTATGTLAHAASAPLALEVLPGRLPPLDWPVGLFLSGVPVPRHLLADADYWRLSEDLFRLLAQGGKTMLTAGPGYRYTPAGFEGADAVRYLKLAGRYGLDQKVVNYGGFPFDCDLSDPAVGRAWEAFRREHGLPVHYLNTYDEPSLPADFPPVFDRLAQRRAAGFKTIGWTSVMDPGKADANHSRIVKESHAAAFNLHSPETLRWANDMGTEAWVYNNGLSRYDQGVHLWRNRRYGARGRVDWIAAIVQGFQFDAMDGREPDLSCFYFHSRHGVLPAPRYLGVVEGSFDARLLSELERRSNHTPRTAWSRKVRELFAEIEAKPYRAEMAWGELESLRARMIVLFLSNSASAAQP